jgi:L-ascorbate metabolism protein UlaG (beta-lactamase superfamily)
VVITAIKHASLRISYNGKEIEVDPVTKVGQETDYSKMPKADYILVTHEHGDHLDEMAVTQLEKEGTVIVSNANSAKILGKGCVLHNGDTLALADDILLEAVPAYNISPGHTQYHPKGRDNGYVLSLGGLRIYIAGDTEDIEEMNKLKHIDIAFLPTNQPYTMTPEQTAKAARIIRPKVLFPYHYSDTPIERVLELLKGEDIDVRIRNYQ